MTRIITVRSFPTEPLPPGRAYVQDDLPRVLTPLGCDYGYTLGVLQADGVVLLEWDVAVDGYELAGFTEHALRTPDVPLSAPFKIGDGPNRRWANAVGNGDRFRPVTVGEPWCYWFGFGLVYLPMKLIKGFLEARQPGSQSQFTDSNFNRWWNHGAMIDWSVRPTHLHGTPNTPY